MLRSTNLSLHHSAQLASPLNLLLVTNLDWSVEVDDALRIWRRVHLRRRWSIGLFLFFLVDDIQLSIGFLEVHEPILRTLF